MGLSDDAIDELRAALPYVDIGGEGESLQGCDLVVIDHDDSGAMELVRWFVKRMPPFPVLLWHPGMRPASAVAESCRDLLFPGRSFAT